VSFTSEQPPEGVSVEGLSSPEPWGSWSVGNKVTVRFDKPLPTQFKLQVTARAYGPNAEKPITLLLGKQKESMAFRSFDSMQTRNIKLKAPVYTLTFVVPKPTSPAELKESTDDRKLGIGLVQVVLLRTKP
jgi:phosphoglycerol transferase